MGSMQINPSQQVETNNTIATSPVNDKNLNISLADKPILSNVPQDELYLIGNNNSQIVQNEEDMTTVKLDAYLDNKNIETKAKGDYHDAYELSHSEVESSVVKKTSESNPYVLSTKDSKTEESTYPGMKGVKEALPYSLEKNVDGSSLELKTKDYLWGDAPSLPYVAIKKEDGDNPERLSLDGQITNTKLIPNTYFVAKENEADTRDNFQTAGEVTATIAAEVLTAPVPAAGYVLAPIAYAYGDDLGDLAYDGYEGLKNHFSADSEKATREYTSKMKDVFQSRFGDKWEHMDMLATLKAYPEGATRIALYEAYNERPQAPASRTQAELADLKQVKTDSGETVYLPRGQTEAKATAKLDFLKGGGYVYAGIYLQKIATKKIGILDKEFKHKTIMDMRKHEGVSKQNAIELGNMIQEGLLPFHFDNKQTAHLNKIINSLPFDFQLEVMYEAGGVPTLLVSPNPEQVSKLLKTKEFGSSLLREMKKMPGLLEGDKNYSTKGIPDYSGTELSKKFRIAFPISEDYQNFSVGLIFDKPREHIKDKNKGIGSHWFSVFTVPGGEVGEDPSFTMKMGVDARTGGHPEENQHKRDKAKAYSKKFSEINSKKELIMEGVKYAGESVLNKASDAIVKRNGFVEVGATIAGSLNPNNFVYDENGVKRYTYDIDIASNWLDQSGDDFDLLPEYITPVLGALFAGGAVALAKPHAKRN